MNVTRPKEKKKHFFYDFLHVRRQNKETKILFMARSRLFLWKDFSWFFFHGEFHSQKKVILFYILKQVLYWKFSKTRLLLVSNDFDHEGQKMFVCVDGVNTKRKTNVTEPWTGFLSLCFVFSHVKSHRKNVFFFFWTCYIHIFWSLKVSTFFLLDLPFFAC